MISNAGSDHQFPKHELLSHGYAAEEHRGPQEPNRQISRTRRYHTKALSVFAKLAFSLVFIVVGLAILSTTCSHQRGRYRSLSSWRGSFGFQQSPASSSPEYNDDRDGRPVPEPQCNYDQHEILHDITGEFNLCGNITLEVIAGNIDITLNPLPGSGATNLNLRSYAGSINVRISEGFEQRAREVLGIVHANTGTGHLLDTTAHTVLSATMHSFNADIHSHAGRITMTTLFGNGGSITVTSAGGAQAITLLGVDHHDSLVSPPPISNLTTHSYGGAQDIVVRPLSSSSSPDTPMPWIAGHHVTVGAGSVSVDYPRGWEGRVRGEVHGSGRARASGAGLRFSSVRRRSFDAVKGRAEVETFIVAKGHGDVDFRC